MKLGKRNLLVVSVMLFALFFGAGNLIFPPFLGQNAGTHTLAAMAGFLATAVILPVLSVMGLQPVALPTVVLSTHTGGLGTPAWKSWDSRWASGLLWCLRC